MRKRNMTALLLALCLLFQIPAVAVDSVSGTRDSLEGARFLVLGDSYTAGYGLLSPELDWTYLMADAYHMTQFNYSISGSSFAAGPYGSYPMVERCLELPGDADPDFILLQGGSNDWAKNIPLGSDDDRQPDCFCGAMNLILDTLQETYPGAVIVCFTPWISDETKNAVGCISQDYVDAMLRICSNRNILCYNAADAEENGMYLNRSEFRTQYCLSAGDWYHLNATGHQMFAPIIARWLEETLCGTSPADRFYDLATSEEALRNAVADLVTRGILDSTGEHLFSPTRSASRETLVLALYRMAGSPQPPVGYALTDVSPDAACYNAVCWAMSEGIFSPSDNFFPAQSVTREMLATAMYRYYTDFCGGFPQALVGLGPFPDGDQVSDYARVPLGWALSCGILSQREGTLRPQSAVSRGQLAESLAVLMRLV